MAISLTAWKGRAPWWALAVSAAMLGGCASAERAQRKAERAAELESVAGDPIKSFRFWNLDRFETVNRSRLVIWTRPDRAYLIDVDEPCPGLEFAQALGVTSTQNRVHNRFDSVLFEEQRCRINLIRPLDVDRLRELRG